MWIYLITCSVNGKKYVGQTRTSVAGRWKQHIADARCVGESRRMKVPLHRAIQKYGPRRFTIATLRECSNQVEANASEVEFINLHQSRDKDRGYNVMPGGIF